MCDEYELYFTRALLAEQMRMRQARAEDRRSKSKGEAAKPTAPAEPERQIRPQETAPA